MLRRRVHTGTLSFADVDADIGPDYVTNFQSFRAAERIPFMGAIRIAITVADNMRIARSACMRERVGLRLGVRHVPCVRECN